MRIVAVCIGAGVFFVDLLTKWLIENTFRLHYYTVVEGFFRIQYVRNEGIAFGLLNDLDSDWKPVLLSLIAVCAIIFVCYYIVTISPPDRVILVSLGLLLGGILGNFTDRVMNHYVVDFLTLHWHDYFVWPTFNAADVAISTGVFLMLYRTFLPGTQQIQAVALIPILMVALPVAQPTSDLVSRLQEKYEGISSLRADFQQTLRSHGINQTESGVLFMKRPGRMYWEYRDPVEKFFVADGERTYFYVPQDHQVMIADLNLVQDGSPLLFLLGRGDIERDFFVSRERESPPREGHLLLRLTPRAHQPEFSHLILDVSAKDFLIRRLVVVEPIGQEIEYELTNLAENVPIPDRQFKLRIPSGVEVIEQ